MNFEDDFEWFVASEVHDDWGRVVAQEYRRHRVTDVMQEPPLVNDMSVDEWGIPVG